MTQQYFSGVLGLAVNQHHQFLLTQRNEPETPDIHQKWQVPGGGIDFGEQPIETLNREMQEELNVQPQLIFPYPITATQVWNHQKVQVHVNLQCFIVTIGQQIPRIGDPETLDYQWVKNDELYRLEYLPLTKKFTDTADKICTQYDLWSSLGVIK